MKLITQNQGMVKVGRDLSRSSGPTPLLRQGHVDQVAQDHVQMAFEDPQGRRPHSLPGQPVPLLSSLTVKSAVQREPSVF